MRDYLVTFYKEYDYDREDAEALLEAYDKIMGEPAAREILEDILATYETDYHMDYEAVIFDRTREMAKASGVHDYTIELLVFTCMTRHLKELYRQIGRSMDIYRDSVLDLKWKLKECKLVKGIRGAFCGTWFPGFFDLSRVGLGRLEFELITAPRDYEGEGIQIRGGKDQVINVHIPRTETPLDKESCDKAYAAAREFFGDKLGGKSVFVCSSWLLYPMNKELLPEYTNTYRFLSEFHIVGWDYNRGEDLWRVFDTDEKNPERLPADTTMRRCYVEHLKKGGRVGVGYGVRL